jgi:hypothetical protein
MFCRRKNSCLSSLDLCLISYCQGHRGWAIRGLFWWSPVWHPGHRRAVCLDRNWRKWKTENPVRHVLICGLGYGQAFLSLDCGRFRHTTNCHRLQVSHHPVGGFTLPWPPGQATREYASLSPNLLLCMKIADDCTQLAKEYQAIQKSPVPYITAHPSEESILLWYYLIEGPPDTPYHGNPHLTLCHALRSRLIGRWTIHGLDLPHTTLSSVIDLCFRHS